MATCSPSRASIFTSRHPPTTRVFDEYSCERFPLEPGSHSSALTAKRSPRAPPDWRNISGNFTTIPEYFKDRGYMTAGMGKTFHEGAASGLAGSSATSPPGATIADPLSCPLCRGEFDADYSWTEPYFETLEIPHEYHDKTALSWIATDPDKGPLPDDYVRRQAISRLDDISLNRQSGTDVRPFFMALGFHKPHLPFVFPERYLSYYPLDEVKLPSNPDAPINMPSIAVPFSSKELREYKDISDITDSQLDPSGRGDLEPLPDAKVKDLRRAYRAAMSYTDDNVGKVLGALKETKLKGGTIVVVVSDHGWSLGEHGLWGKHTNFATVTNAPLMFRVPGRTDGGIFTDQIVSTTDVFPTLVDLAFGTAMPKCGAGAANEKLCTEGASLAPLISDPMKPVKTAAYSFFDRPIPTKVDPEWPVDFDDVVASLGPRRSNTNASSSWRHRRPKSAVSLVEEPSKCIDGSGCVMGYSMVTRLEGCELRYTEWVLFAGWGPNWDVVYGKELYNHSCYCSPSDHRRHKVTNVPETYLAPMFFVDVLETNNVFSSASAAVVAELHERLRTGWQSNFD